MPPEKTSELTPEEREKLGNDTDALSDLVIEAIEAYLIKEGKLPGPDTPRPAKATAV